MSGRAEGGHGWGRGARRERRRALKRAGGYFSALRSGPVETRHWPHWHFCVHGWCRCFAPLTSPVYHKLQPSLVLTYTPARGLAKPRKSKRGNKIAVFVQWRPGFLLHCGQHKTHNTHTPHTPHTPHTYTQHAHSLFFCPLPAACHVVYNGSFSSLFCLRALKPSYKIDWMHAPSSPLSGGTLLAQLLVIGDAQRAQDIAQGLALAHNVLVARDWVAPARDHLRRASCALSTTSKERTAMHNVECLL